MALTSAEGAKLSNDVLLEGVIETVINDSPILQRLPFIEIRRQRADLQPRERRRDGELLRGRRHLDGEHPTFTQISTALTILGGDADIDNYVARTRNNVQDIEAAVVELKAKAVQQKFDDTFITGDTGTDANAFDGIDVLCAAGQTVSMGTNGVTMTLDKLDDLVDLVRGGKPEMLLMSRRSRRTLKQLARASGSGVVEHDRDEFGRMVAFYDGIAIGVNDYITDDKTVGTSSDCSTIYALQFGEGAVAGLTGPGGLAIERVGALETKDATRVRVKWYVTTALCNELKLAKLIGVRP